MTDLPAEEETAGQPVTQSEMVHFEMATLGPPYGSWQPVPGTDLEVMARATDRAGVLHVRRRAS